MRNKTKNERKKNATSTNDWCYRCGKWNNHLERQANAERNKTIRFS